MPTDIRQLTKAGTQFYPQTHIAALVGYGENGESIDSEPTVGSSNLVDSKSVKDTPWVRPENTNFMYRKNIFEGTWEYGGLITASTNQGDEFESDEICRTDFMPVKPSTNYVFMGFRDAAARVYDAMYAFFYNTEKECVGMVVAYEGATVPTTSDTAYIRIRTRDGHCPSAATQEVIRMTMLEGTVPATEYTPSDVAFSSKIVLPEYDEVIEEVDASSYENTLNLSKNVNYISERTGNYSSSHWSSLGSHMIIPLDDVSVVVIASNSSLPSSYAFIKGYSNNGIVFCTGVINTTDLAAGSMTRISASSVPSDAKYLYVRCIDSLERDCTPRIIDINGINYVESKANKQALQIKNIPFVVGIYNSSGGIYTNNNTYNGIVGTYVRTKDVLFVKAGSFINGSYYMTILKYNSSDMDDIASVTYQGATTGYVFNNDGYYTITLRKSDYSKLLPETIDIISTIYTTKDYNYVESAFIGGSGYYNAGGDCTLFQTPNAKNVIIDFSNLGPMSGAVKKALYYRGVFRVDAAVVSHYHSDHTQGLCYALVNKVLDFTHCTFYLPDDTSMQYVIDNMGEGERFYGDYDTSSHETYVLINSYFDAEPDQEGNVTLTWNGSTYTVPQFQGTVVYPDHDGQTAIIDGLEIVFWNTDHSVYTSSGNGTYNEFSLCCDVLFGQKRICMAGDIGPVGEEQIQNHMKKANILKAQHHGWENSVMNSDFICRVYPEIVVTEDSSEHDMLIYRETSPLQSWCEKNGVPNYRTRTNGVMDFVITDKSISATSVMKNFVRGGIDWCLTYGDSANRPKSCRPGMQYFDTTIGKPIYWCVNDNHPSGAWVDSTGEAV